MGNVIDLSTRFARKEEPAQVKIERAIEDVIANWQRCAAKNQLNDFIIQSIPSWAEPDIHYLSDVSALGFLETRLGIDVQIQSPAFVEGQIGWVVSFRVGDYLVATPPMPFEAYARSFAVVLCLILRRRLVTES